MKKHLYFFCISVLLLQNCSFLEQKDFIETKVVSSNDNEKIIYKYYKTGVHDYKVDFYSVDGSGSTKLFEHYINDALLSADTYTISENNNELVISTRLFSQARKLITRSGKSIILTNR